MQWAICTQIKYILQYQGYEADEYIREIHGFSTAKIWIEQTFENEVEYQELN